MLFRSDPSAVGVSESCPILQIPQIHTNPYSTKYCSSLIPRYAYAHAADPEYSLRQSTLRQLSFETLFCRAYLIEIPWGGDPREPKGTQWDPRGPKGTQRNPRGPKGRGPKGGQGDPRAPSAPLGGNGAMGPFGVIPKPFRIESHFEWKVITNGKTF